jgi:hypothetical protein
VRFANLVQAARVEGLRTAQNRSSSYMKLPPVSRQSGRRTRLVANPLGIRDHSGL